MRTYKTDVENLDGCEEDNPIRKLNVEYDIPVEIGKLFIGKTEQETEYNVNMFRETLNKIIENKVRQTSIELCNKIHIIALTSLRCILKDVKCVALLYGFILPANIMSSLVTLSNIMAVKIKELCDDYRYSGIDIKKINEEYVTGNYDDIRLGIKYWIGDCVSRGNIPYGYNVDEHRKLVENPDEMIVINKIYAMYYNGSSYEDIAKYLTEHNVASKMGDKWSDNLIRDIVNRGVKLQWV